MYTIEDISRMTGVGKAIISRYFNGYNVRKKNKLLIEEAVRETGYMPNESARSLRARSTKVIGVIVPTLDDSFTMTIIHNVEVALKDYGYSLFVTDCLSDKKNELPCVKMMLRKRVDALIILPLTHLDEIYLLTSQNNIPLIVFDQHYENDAVDFILFENDKGAYRAAEILIENGHEKTAVLLGPLTDYTPNQRFKGFRECMQANGIGVREEYIKVGEDYSMNSGYLGAKELLQSSDRPTAIFAANYDMTLGAMKAINEFNLNIPDEISIIAFDLMQIHDVIRPPLWTVIQPLVTIGNKIADITMKRVKGEASNEKIHYIPYEIFEGKSVKNLKRVSELT